MMEKENLVKAIILRRIGMVESVELSMAQAAINQKLMELDLVAHRVEMKWGIGRLLELAPAELRGKWASQVAKLEAAVMAEDVLLVEELVLGSCRGWAMLERVAQSAGHVPYEPLTMEVKIEDVIYQVVRFMEDTHALASRSAAERPVICLEELCRVYHGRHAATFPAREVGQEYVASGLPMDQEIGF